MCFILTVIGTEYCLEEPLETQCSADEIIHVDSARYGRMQLNRCVRTDYGYIGCGADVTDIMAGKCSGRRRCRIVNLEALFATSRTCPTDLKSYLETTYSCVKGERSGADRLCPAFLSRFSAALAPPATGLIYSLIRLLLPPMQQEALPAQRSVTWQRLDKTDGAAGDFSNVSLDFVTHIVYRKIFGQIAAQFSSSSFSTKTTIGIFTTATETRNQMP